MKQFLPAESSPITLGESLKTFNINGLIFTETTHIANKRLSRHYHERANIAFVLKGSFAEVLDKRRFECAPQSMIVKPAGEAHANHYGGGGLHCVLIELEPDRVESLHPFNGIFDLVSHIRAEMPSMLASRIYREMNLMDTASPLAIEGLSLELFAELFRSKADPTGHIPTWLKHVREILHADFADPVSLAWIAQHVGIHPVHIARSFRKHFGCTLGEYLRRLRIRSACDKLSSSDTPLVDIALSSGFSHQAHFSRQFKSQIGMTPRQYRSIFRRTR